MVKVDVNGNIKFINRPKRLNVLDCPTTATRVVLANQFLELEGFSPMFCLEKLDGSNERELYIVRNQTSLKVKLNEETSERVKSGHVVGLGMTYSILYGQLARFIKQQSHYGSRIMVCLCNRREDNSAKLRRYEAEIPEFCKAFDNPDLTSCVLCGKTDVGGDWWNYGGLTGPCCLYNRCLTEYLKAPR